MTISGDALAAKLAELVRDGGEDSIWSDLLAWVAEQGAAVANQCDGCRAGMPLRDGIHYRDDRPHIGCTADRYASPIPATRGNRPADARTGAALKAWAYGARHGVGDRVVASTDWAPREGDREMGRAADPCWIVLAPHDAPAPDAALRAAGMADAERAIFEAIARRGVPPLVGGAAHRTYTNGMERALEIVRAARAALSPDATGGDA